MALEAASLLAQLRLSLARVPVAAALEMLDAHHEAQCVRRFAVCRLALLPDHDLAQYLMQLVTALKHEPYHDSALARFLVFRALRNRSLLGQHLFWLLHAEREDEAAGERYALINEAYLSHCGDHRLALIPQLDFVQKTEMVLARVSEHSGKKQRSAALKHELNRLVSLPRQLSMPYDATLASSDLLHHKCKMMDSAQAPLWLTFDNADRDAGMPFSVIFKKGDDLRQDALTNQMFSIMAKIWGEEGIDIHMSPYSCLPTGRDSGLIEVVPDAHTTASIQKKAGGGVRGAFMQAALRNWIAKHNPSDTQMERAVDNFIRSCAGYCVATHVLGIGDRHNDNVMITKSGHLFHIDFGHFLGNWERFAGISRDRAPFVFTPEMCFVMGGKSSEGFEQFCELSCLAYNSLRRNADIFISLFSLMVSAGTAELNKYEDIAFITQALSLELSDEAAAAHFRKLIHKALNTTYTRVNNAIHLMFSQASSS
eukprot:TRINITY_DN13641_c1_g1_i1.p1 TRINITY_DN13641_c1_g1~~TRINITY_DN13641_c1_g1_i1.p1  ORF type:complete len:543 (-),score=203.77 TRINITY_DN13641_c1_g1_i1:409-1857(-)